MSVIRALVGWANGKQNTGMSVDKPAKRIMIVTGESSGDLHGANLIKAAKALSADMSFFGVGGRKMAAAGCEILIPSEKLAVMGLVEVIGHLPVIWRTFQQLKRELTGSQKPDALVLIDFPDFNLRLAHQAKKAGVPVLYYISPKVWAWRKGRVKKIAESVDSLAVIFPFEPSLYDGLDILWMLPLRMDYYRRRRQIPALCLGRRRANLKRKSAG